MWSTLAHPWCNNRIKFMDKNGQTYDVALVFYKSHIKHLAKINNYDDFVTFLEQIYEESLLNSHAMSRYDKDRERKLVELWDIWTKIFGPKYVFDNLKELIEY